MLKPSLRAGSTKVGYFGTDEAIHYKEAHTMLNPTQQLAIAKKIKRTHNVEGLFKIVDEVVKITIEDRFENRRFFEIDKDGSVTEIE